jgi:hypothetical protein
VEQAGNDEQRTPYHDRQRAPHRNQHAGEQHGGGDGEFRRRQIDAVDVHHHPDRHGRHEQRRQREVEPADADYDAKSHQKREMVRPDHGMAETG